MGVRPPRARARASRSDPRTALPAGQAINTATGSRSKSSTTFTTRRFGAHKPPLHHCCFERNHHYHTPLSLSFPATSAVSVADNFTKVLRARVHRYTTSYSFAAFDKWDIRDAPDRRVRRLMEKENKKIRDVKKRVWVQNVRVRLADAAAMQNWVAQPQPRSQLIAGRAWHNSPHHPQHLTTHVHKLDPRVLEQKKRVAAEREEVQKERKPWSPPCPKHASLLQTSSGTKCATGNAG